MTRPQRRSTFQSPPLRRAGSIVRMGEGRFPPVSCTSRLVRQLPCAPRRCPFAAWESACRRRSNRRAMRPLNDAPPVVVLVCRVSMLTLASDVGLAPGLSCEHVVQSGVLRAVGNTQLAGQQRRKRGGTGTSRPTSPQPFQRLTGRRRRNTRRPLRPSPRVEANRPVGDAVVRHHLWVTYPRARGASARCLARSSAWRRVRRTGPRVRSPASPGPGGGFGQ